MKNSIVIPTYNHLSDCLKPCLESLILYTDLSDTEVIVSANGCTDGTREYVESLAPAFKLVWSDKPTGFTIGTNDGLKVATGEFVILLSNDTILLPQPKHKWVEMLTSPLEDSLVGITGPMKVKWENGQDFLIFFCAAMKRNLFDKIGFLDEIFNPGFCEDVDFCFRAVGAGFKILQVPFDSQSYYEKNRMVGGFPIFHKGEETLKHLNEFDSIIKRNTDIVRSRYLFNGNTA